MAVVCVDRTTLAWGIVAVMATILGACSDSSPTQPADSVNTLQDGFVMVRQAEKSVVLGTDSPLAKMNERPQMGVQLAYNYQIGKHEVTCGEFNELMKEDYSIKLDCENDSLPVVDITYYDAALYANAKSKKAKRDTAYKYSSAEFDKNGHCVLLNGFVFDSDAKSFRLPTEAEWMFVAHETWDTIAGWTSENSDYKLHKVCSIPGQKVCDMLGNAMEWVNDWNGNFRDTVLTNYVGAPDGGSWDMRVVKGGSFRNALETINLFNRGDVYTVTSSTRSEYVGFRLAYGPIPDAVWMDASGKATVSRVVPLANASIVNAETGSSRVKLAFRNDLTGNLAYIDFSSGVPHVVEIEDTIEVYHPEISPDGKRVAFCTKYEGISGKSELYVRDLNVKGTNLVKLNAPSAAIPRWRVLGNGDTVIVFVNDAGNNKDESSFSSTSTWRVRFANGKFGKPEKLFNGAYHGGISEDNSLAVSGARLLRVRKAKAGSNVTREAVDTVWYGGEQACNVSLAKDFSKRTMFLDFGGKTGEAFVGSKYSTHERLLVADSTGKLIQSIAAPQGYTFDHSEWASGVGDIAVATIANTNGVHSKIDMINLSDSNIVDLVEGDELWHPNLWVKKSTKNLAIDSDSAGVYFKDGQSWSSISLGYKMSLLWKFKDDVEILCVGSSRTEKSIVVTAMTSGFALNVGHMGNDMNMSLHIAENYGLNHMKKLKYIVVAIDLDLWHNSMEYTEKLMTASPGLMYDWNHDFWQSGIPEGFLGAVEEASQSSAMATSIYEASRGFFNEDGSSWGTASVELDSNWGNTVDEIKIKWNLKRLRNFIDQMDLQDIYVIGAIFPQNPKYRETGSWGRYGPCRSVAYELLDTLKNYQKIYPHFILMDENQNGDHDYTEEMAMNADHLSILGASQFTGRLDYLIKTLK